VKLVGRKRETCMEDWLFKTQLMEDCASSIALLLATRLIDWFIVQNRTQ